jgi:hypothetical protein
MNPQARGSLALGFLCFRNSFFCLAMPSKTFFVVR